MQVRLSRSVSAPSSAGAGHRRLTAGRLTVRLAWKTGIPGKNPTPPDGYGRWEQHGHTVRFFLEFYTGTESLTSVARKLDGYQSFPSDAFGILLFSLHSARRETGLRAALGRALAGSDPGVVIATTARHLAHPGRPRRPGMRSCLRGQRPGKSATRAISRTLAPPTRRIMISSGSAKFKKLPDNGVRLIDGIPPLSRNHREPNRRGHTGSNCRVLARPPTRDVHPKLLLLSTSGSFRTPRRPQLRSCFARSDCRRFGVPIATPHPRGVATIS